MISGIVAVMFIGTAWGLTALRSDTSGDPGSKVMNQLTPTVSALPGYDVGSIPWVDQIPQMGTGPYAVKIKPISR